MAELANVLTRLRRMTSAINNALTHEVADVARQAVRDAAMDIVYSYEPKVLYSRRMENGGLIDFDNMPARAVQGVLTVWNITPLQDQSDRALLAPIVEEGDRNYHMPYPRPFMEEAQNMLDNGLAENALIAGLLRQGYDIKGGF